MFKDRTIEPNPIIIKELRSRMRGPRPFITLTGMLILLSGITYIAYRISMSYYDYYTGIALSAQIGQTLFTMLIFLLLLFILIITPAVTTNAISSEKENLTYEMLMTTPLHPAKILWGKLFSALSYVFLLIFAAIPIASLIFVFGGVTIRVMVKSIIILITIAITTGIFGLLMSTLLKRSSRATVVSYVVIAILIIGSILIFGAIGVLINDEPPRWILVLNPVSIMASGISGTTYNSYSLGLMPVLAADFSAINGSTVGLNFIPRPLYHYSLPIMGYLSIFMYALATRLLVPSRRWRVSRKDAIVFVGVIAALTAIMLAGFFSTVKNYELATMPESGMIEGLIDQFAPVSVEIPVMPVKEAQLEAGQLEEVSILEISDADLATIYSQALLEAIAIWEKSSPFEIETVYLLQTIAIDEDENSNYSLPAEYQTQISDNLETLGIKSNWIVGLEEIMPISAVTYTFMFTTAQINTDGTGESVIYGYEHGVLDFEYSYTFTNEEMDWIILDSSATYYEE